MSRTSAKKAKSAKPNPFQLREAKELAREEEPIVHVFGEGFICDTDSRGYATPRGRTLREIVVDASKGFIPLWIKGTTLRWRFQERSIRSFEDPAAAKTEIRNLLGDALLAWGDSAPVKFTERDDACDFEIEVRRADDCSINGCTLARAFFPDAGQHTLELYPRMFTQSRKEQVDTLIHELGHIFGLRHFFANISETAWPSEIFGIHRPFTIMNYGAQSELTADDKNDMKRLYQAVWMGMLTNINGTPIRLMKPFHAAGEPPENMVAVGQIQTVFQPQPRATYTSGI